MEDRAPLPSFAPSADGKLPPLFRHAGQPLTESILPQGSAKTMKGLTAMLGLRTVELAAAKVELGEEILYRREVEGALGHSERQNELSLEQLRHLTRRLLVAQEEERRTISRELHDVISQTLVGIHHRISNLRQRAAIGGKVLDDHVAETQALLAQSIETVQTFARNLRPAVLDDLGLIPALGSFLGSFTARTGIITRLSASPDLAPLCGAWRTALFRVAQEALANVEKHAQAGLVVVRLEEFPAVLRMTVQDDGRSFDVAAEMLHKEGLHLGLLGMRERLEMIGGSLVIESSAGRGTSIRASIPLGGITAPFSRIRPS